MKKITYIFAVLFIPLIFSGCGTMNQSLHIPAKEGDLQKVKAEIEAGKKVDSKDAAGQTALMYAAGSGRMEVVEYLLSRGADVNAVSGTFGAGTALSYAASANRLEVMEYLIAKGANVNLVSRRGESPLFFAARQGHDEAVKFLLENGANAKIKNKNDQTALNVAVSNNHGEVAQILQNYEE